MIVEFTTVVTGLPRSGTSLMMQMLMAGGLPLLTDDARADEHRKLADKLALRRKKSSGVTAQESGNR